MNPKKTLIGIFIGVLVLTSLIIINHFLILSRIYYRISYEGTNFTLSNDFERIVEKSELFDYQKYCKCRDSFGIIHNLTNSDYVDREFIINLKTKIVKDHEKFHLYPFYGRNFVYSLDATNETLTNLTYNNESIIKIEDSTHNEIFNASKGIYKNTSSSWYLNFTEIPFNSGLTSTIQLNHSILVKMNLQYDYNYGFGTGATFLTIEQYICFNSDLQTIFVCIPLAATVMA